MPDNNFIPSVAIVGEGSAKIAHYLLSKKFSNQFSIMGFEASHRSGGHIHSVPIPLKNGKPVKVTNENKPKGKLSLVDGTSKYQDEIGREFYIVEGGAEFLNSNYTELLALFKDIDITTQEFNMTMAIHHLAENEKFVVSTKLSDIIQNFESEKGEEDLYYKVREIFSGFEHLRQYVALAIIIHRAKSLSVSTKTLENFIDEIQENWFYDLLIPDDFVEQYFFPLLASAWGVDVAEMKNFCAHYAMNYLTVGNKFLEVKGGLSQYINKLDTAIDSKDIAYNTKITRIEPCHVDGKDWYRLYTKDESGNEEIIANENDLPELFSDLIISTPAEVSALMLDKINDPLLLDVVSKLKKVRYYDTKICFCKISDEVNLDRAQVVNVFTDGKHKPHTEIIKNHLYPGITKKWVHSPEEMPSDDELLISFDYRHPYMDKHYFEAQEALNSYNAKNTGIQFAGILASFDDSHTGAAFAAGRSAINIHMRNEKENELDKLFTSTNFVPAVIKRMDLDLSNKKPNNSNPLQPQVAQDQELPKPNPKVKSTSCCC